jgi:hypothetical protein
MNKIRAKMQVNSVYQEPNLGETVHLHAVYSGSEENKSFSASTPCANLVMTISNPAAQGFFVKGKEYYLDFTACEPFQQNT